MKASGRFLSAASAVALSAALVVPGAVVLQFAFVSVAQAAVVSRSKSGAISASMPRRFATISTIKPGKSFSIADIDEAVKRLFATGLFSDVSVNQVGSTLVVQVDEYQVVNQVLFQGNKKLKDAELASRGAAEAARHVLARSARRRRRGDQGRPIAGSAATTPTVTTQIMDLGENRVNVVFEINEGGRTKIAGDQFRRQQRLQRPPPVGRHRDQALDGPVLRPARRHL